ncbi:MAG: hypothetical protein GQ582_12545 [Methyloprofundus sp.]|nr:hypothetical protein [Methyloprofundus sp.]
MIKLLKVSAILVVASMGTACTNYALEEDFNRLRADVSALEVQMAAISDQADAANAKAEEVAVSAGASAATAQANSEAAMAAANRAADIAEELSRSTNRKLDSLLNKAMMK